MLIRTFTREDQAAARQLILDGLAERFDVIDPAANPDLDDIWTSYPAAGHFFCIVEDGPAVTGAGALIVTGVTGQIARVSVARGSRRQGIGRIIVQHLLAQSRRCGLERVWTETNDDWHDAIALYASCGFTEFDRRDGCVFMSLDL